jgi:hypothetical protein
MALRKPRRRGAAPSTQPEADPSREPRASLGPGAGLTAKAYVGPADKRAAAGCPRPLKFWAQVLAMFYKRRSRGIPLPKRLSKEAYRVRKALHLTEDEISLRTVCDILEKYFYEELAEQEEQEERDERDTDQDR